jgi:hypothetical protein
MIRRLLLTAAAAGLAAAMVTGPAADAAAGKLARPEQRRAFFGELHLHTGYSFDAFALMGTRTEPDTAYRFGQGLPVEYLGKTVRRSRPLDFMAVTDHAEYLGANMALLKPDAPLLGTEFGRVMRDNPIRIAMGRVADLVTPESSRLLEAAMASAWQNVVANANRHYKPGKFTTFVAYEWTSHGPNKENLHRNVIFRGAAPPKPFTAADSERPEDLWTFIEGLRAKGVESLAIPHNSNGSGGLMFDWNDSDGKPISEAYAQRRALNEPLIEAFQNKGQSETSPLLSPADEFSEFERYEELINMGPSPVNGSFGRQALGRGLVVEGRTGANPFKFGFVSGSDFHNGLSDSAEGAYAGIGLSSTDPKVNLPDLEFARRVLMQDPSAKPDPATLQRDRSKENIAMMPGRLNYSSAGLTGVWAEENTREAIFDALRRKETFATSGPALRIRMFGGWSFAADMMRRSGWTGEAYRTGVPMGGDLPEGRGVPTFLFEAAKDPLSGNLDRIQVIKLWLEGDGYREKVFDVVWSPERHRDPLTGKVPAVKDTVDLKTATWTNDVGAPVLSGFWRDSEFDPRTPAVYYARVLEIPTPRWTTRLAAARGVPLPKGVPATIQERAITSPIWYTPH